MRESSRLVWRTASCTGSTPSSAHNGTSGTPCCHPDGKYAPDPSCYPDDKRAPDSPSGMHDRPPLSLSLGPLSLSHDYLSSGMHDRPSRMRTAPSRDLPPPGGAASVRGDCSCHERRVAVPRRRPPLFNRHREPDFDRIESNRFQHHLILTGEHKKFRRHKPPCPEGVRRLGTGLVPVRRQGFSVFTALSLREPFRAPAFAVWACRRHALGALWTGGPEEPI